MEFMIFTKHLFVVCFQIDPTFLDALPPELRSEIQNAYASEQKAKDESHPQLPSILPTEKEDRPRNSPATSPYKTFENLMAAVSQVIYVWFLQGLKNS